MSPSALGLGVAERILGAERPTVESAVGAVQAAHQALALEMGAVIGDVGFAASFARCVRKAREEHPCLDHAVTRGAPETFLDRLWECLGRLDPSGVRAVGVSLIARFFDLMTTFVGRELTLRLFHNTWPEAVPSPPESPEKQ